MARLNDIDRNRLLAELDGWEPDGIAITKKYVFADFSESIGFVTRVAMLSEVADHHPDIDIRWNKVTITLTTHEEQGLTEKDTSLAKAIESL